jgi:hypothetical protein
MIRGASSFLVSIALGVLAVAAFAPGCGSQSSPGLTGADETSGGDDASPGSSGAGSSGGSGSGGTSSGPVFGSDDGGGGGTTQTVNCPGATST